jgi:hypothetical protein
MKTAMIEKPLQVVPRILQVALTASYLGAYRYYTLEPIEVIERDPDEIASGKLRKALVAFRQAKDEELSFVSKAVGQFDLLHFRRSPPKPQRSRLPNLFTLQAALSAAAVIGVFSWPSTEKTVWAAKMLWNWSFFMSTFALVGSAPTRLLQHLPDKHDTECDEHRMQMALNLFLRPRAKSGRPSGAMGHRGICGRMLWAWQCPAMLMSYSWVLCE